jgi:TolB-like protein/Flp pilus assembly protein TadD
MQAFLDQLKGRGVLKIATAYLAACWLILEVGKTVFEIFGLRPLVLQILFGLMVIGFLVAMVVAWRYRVGALAADDQSDARHGQQLAIILASAAVLVGAIILGVRLWGGDISGEQSVKATASNEAVASAGSAVAPTAPAFSPPAHSVAVLPFVNLSGDANDDYFSDGLSEELLNALARVNELSVAARTSSFSFRGTNADILTVGRKLNVGAVLEGGVRKVGKQVRITARLINAVNGFLLWSESYDRQLDDIFELQSAIASAAAQALKVTLLSDVRDKVQLGGTPDSEAFDSYLRGLKLSRSGDEASTRAALAAFDEAIGRSPQYALAHAARARALNAIANVWSSDVATRTQLFEDAQKSAERAIAIAPTLGAGHSALALILEAGKLDFAGAEQAYRRAVTLEPGSATTQRSYATFAALMGRSEDAIRAAERALTLDPLSTHTHSAHGWVLLTTRHFQAALEAHRRVLEIDPKSIGSVLGAAEAYQGLQQHENARQLCTKIRETWMGQLCLAISLHHLGRKSEAAAVLAELRSGPSADVVAYQMAQIYAQWQNPRESLKWLDAAYAARDSGLNMIKTDFLLDPVRDTPRFKEIEAKLNFP